MKTIRNIAKKTPIALSGLLLGVSSIGNFIPEARPFFALIASIIIVLLINKLLFDSNNVISDIMNPALTGIAATFPMALSILSIYILPYNDVLAKSLWFLGITLSLVLIVIHLNILRKKPTLKLIFPSTFIVYVGISVNAFFAGRYSQVILGKVLFWFGFIAFLVLLPLVLIRIYRGQGLPEPMVPTLAILASPASVLLNAYLALYKANAQVGIVWILFGFAFALWAYVVFKIPALLRVSFNPSYASLTFPMVVSGVATKSLQNYLLAQGTTFVFIKFLALITYSFALFFVLFVLGLFIQHFVFKPLNICARKEASDSL